MQLAGEPEKWASLEEIAAHLGVRKDTIRIRLPRVVALILTAIIAAYGVYGVATTSFVRWLTMPFTSGAEAGADLSSASSPA